MDIESAATIIIDSILRVHRALAGLLESAYQQCRAHELRKRGLTVELKVVSRFFAFFAVKSILEST